ncbi:MAG: hypothetical protein V4735_06305 [Pseudomonadota bacterium]
MLKSPAQGIESIAVRRATVTDADKVRYRVYSTPSEFIAVIAESALMAVRVSGVKKPHKIVRDLPTEGIAVEARKMAAVQPSDERISIPTTRKAGNGSLTTEMAPQNEVKASLFQPMAIGDLQGNGLKRARILPPELISQIIEDHAKSVAATVAQVEAIAEAPRPAPPEPVPEESLSTEEKITRMAAEMFPSESAAPIDADVKLSPEEVEKLLHG